ncbi:hypothetical protein VTH06DRAFT_6277 [Thermothelomyces fergusii]
MAPVTPTFRKPSVTRLGARPPQIPEVYPGSPHCCVVRGTLHRLPFMATTEPRRGPEKASHAPGFLCWMRQGRPEIGRNKTET